MAYKTDKFKLLQPALSKIMKDSAFVESKIKNTSEYKTISLEETYKLLETTTNGLSDTEVKIRLEKFGNNEIAEKKQNVTF